MAYIITETCVDLKDRSCVDVCPVDCIIDGGAEDRMLVINPDECIDCGACVDPCPGAAMYPEDGVPAELKGFIPWNFDYFKSDEDKARVRAEINAAYPEKSKTEVSYPIGKIHPVTGLLRGQRSVTSAPTTDI